MEYRGLLLDRFQREAIEHVEAGDSVLVAAPTGTGKTLIADFLIEKVLEDGGEVIYTAPVKALSNQKYRQYCERFGREAVGLITGDLVINRDAPIRIMTTEILRNMLLEGHRLDDEDPREVHEILNLDEFSPTELVLPELGNLRAVIIDEIHFLDDPDRGTVWEELLIYLPSRIRILGLSATLSNLDEFASWLSQIRETSVKVVLEKERTVPLEINLATKDAGLLDVNKYEKEYRKWKKEKAKQEKDKGRRRGSRGGRKRRGESSETNHLDVLDLLPRDHFPALYFIYSRKMVEVLATKLANHRIGKSLESRKKRKEIESRLQVFEERFPKVLDRKLRSMYLSGIAFHHAGLHVALKALVEELYESRLLEILYCTSTFALGINMPARTVIFDGLTKFDGSDFVPLSIREFMQMAGRAGRRGIDARGTVVIRQDFQHFEEVRGLLKRLMTDESEPVRSAFNLSFHSVVNLLDRFDEEAIRFMLDQSFKAYQDAKMAGVVRHRLEEGPQDGEGNRKDRRERAALQRELALLERPRLWETFQKKVAFLRSFGYLGAQNELNTPARILRHIKIEEILVTELILQGVIDELSADEVFGVMVGLVQTLPRTARVALPKDEKWFSIFESLKAVYESEILVGAEELMEQETNFTLELMPMGERWAQGETLQALLADIRNPTDLAGDLVGGFRRAKDLVSQIRQVHRQDETRWKEFTDLLKRVTRDEVEVLD